MAFPFPSPFPKVLNDSPPLTAALAGAMTEARTRFPALRTAIAIAAVDETTFPTAFSFSGDGHTDTNYSGSLLKVAAMFAAFQLRDSADATAQASSATTSAATLAELSAAFDSTITSAVPLIPAGQRKPPDYRKVFGMVSLLGGGFSAVFNADFETQLRNMIVPGSNQAAAQCVIRLGYSWINGTLANGGFFDSAQQGIWLAGTFTGALPPVRIPSVNDGPSAQATTCVDLLNLYALMVQGTLVSPNASSEMLTLLSDAASGPEPAFITRPGIISPGFSLDVTHTKIGLGPLKPENGGFDVFSEGSILRHRASGRRFITVWQNTDAASLAQIPIIIDKAVNSFLLNP